ncbi:MAG: hypothetical protein QM796_22585 [Chthoniobacteraceae bacterium]
MSQPVKLSDALVLDARIASQAVERSIAGQVEFWARLGRAIEPLLQAPQVLALCQKAIAKPLSECIAEVETPVGRERLKVYLETLPFPHYEPVEGNKDLLIRIDADGTRTTVQFISDEWVAVKPARKKRAKATVAAA